MKITVIGAGNVGATLAMRIVEKDMADVVLIDVVEGMPQGKAIDISDAAAIFKHDRSITGTNDFGMMKGSDIVVMTAGFPRKPGMSREDLILTNAGIVKGVVGHIKERCPKAALIIVTNPLDLMAFYAFRTSGMDRSKVIGMSGTLDTARFANLIAEELKVSRKAVKTMVLGCHGDDMVPLVSMTTVGGKKITEIVPAEVIDRLVKRTQNRGAEVVGLLKTGSAYYSPSAGVIEILEAMTGDTGAELSVSAFLDGEYGIKDCFLSVPSKITKNGIERVLEYTVSDSERASLAESAARVKKLIGVLPR